MLIEVNNQNIKIIDSTITVSHSVGIYYADFIFDETWNEWNKTAVFQLNKETPVEVVIVDNQAEIPNEVLIDKGHLTIGVYGTQNEKVMPTRYNAHTLIRLGTPTGSIHTEPTPSVYAQILERLRFVEDMTASAETLPSGFDATAKFNDGVLTLGIPQGEKGEKGDQGEKGDTGEVSKTELNEVVKTLEYDIITTNEVKVLF